ncbi:MAG: class I SAM-dependent methyltransferase [Microcoleaceae cyanobacterium]
MNIRSTDLGCHEHNLSLFQFVKEQVRVSSQRRITFSEYMNWVLYHPEFGYYNGSQPKIGAGGDFFTSVHLGPDFGELLAEQFVELWEVLGCPEPFTLVEMGAGQGILAVDILQYLQERHPEFLRALTYGIIEHSPRFRTEQAHRLKPWSDLGCSIQWLDWEAIPQNSITGCFFSNELVDAFPVHQVVFENGQLQEVYVTVDLGSEDANPQSLQFAEFTEVIGDLSTPQLSEYFQFLDIHFNSELYPDHYRTEVNLAALDWMTTIASKLHQGFVLTIDYGYSAQKYYSPMRQGGTLQCYFQHRYHNHPYLNIGYQDLTAHVNFTALEKQGERWGLETVGFTQQALFLMALGLGDRLATLSQPSGLSLSAVLRHREALHSLINPMGLGNFGVLIQSKGLNHLQPIKLKGLSVPDP